MWCRTIIKEKLLELILPILPFGMCCSNVFSSDVRGSFSGVRTSAQRMRLSLLRTISSSFAPSYVRLKPYRLPVHVRDMDSLERNHIMIYRKFLSGAFVIKKTNNPFSSIALEHAHEQENAFILKVGLTKS